MSIRNVEKNNETPFISIIGNESSLEKSDRYNWQKDFGEMGSFQMLDKKLLKIDLDYQREAKSRMRVLSIARDLRWTLFGVIIVIKNGNDYFVVDGAHRARASMLRDEIKTVPCMVYSAKSIQEEADLFVKLNTIPIGVGAYQRHKAGLVAGYATAKIAERIVNSCSYKIVATSPKDWEIECVGAIYSMIIRNENMAENCFKLLSEISMGQSFTSMPLKGLFYLMSQNQHIDFFSFPLKNMQYSGISNIEGEIKRFKAFKGKGGEKVFGEAMLEIINKGQNKNRVSIPF
jgi:hypothetical protein